MERAEKMGTLLKSSPKARDRFGIYAALMFIIGLTMITPLIFMISASFKPAAMITQEPLKIIPDHLFLDNFKAVFTHPYYFKWYLNSIVVVAAVIIFRVFFVTMAGYAFARLKFPFKDTLFILVFSIWMIPSDTTIISRYLFYKYLHLIDSLWVVILPAVFDVFLLFLIRQFFMQIPFDLTESALIDGCPHFKIYYLILLPLAKPALLTMVLFTFIWTWNAYAEPFVFINKQEKQLITVGLQYFQEMGGSNIAMQLAGACLGIIPPVVLFIIAQKYFIQGIATSGIKG